MKLIQKAYAYTGLLAVALTLGAGRAHADTFNENSRIDPQGNPSFADPNTDFSGGIIRIASRVLNVILLLAGILAVFYLVWSGIQYITSAGSPDKAKAARAGIINSVIGIIIIVAAYFIIRVAVGIGNELSRGI